MADRQPQGQDRMAEMEAMLAAMQRQLALNNQMGPFGERALPILLNNMYRPPTDQFQGGGWGPNVNANNFELNPALISMIQAEQFGGGVSEDPNAHLEAFLDICDTIKQNGLPADAIRMRMFGFSLRSQAKEWFKSLDRSRITTWEQLCEKFLSKYFPPAKAQKIIAEISHFSQLEDESLFEA